jgi:RNAse (barnase) inhibitor barstar
MDHTTVTLEIDGSRFSSLEGFYDEVSRVLIPGEDWGHNLDALNDVLRGGFGTPEGGFRMVWLHSEKSRTDLGYAETARQLALRLERCHPSNQASVANELKAAREKCGSTVFDWLVTLIECHDDIELVLA